MAGSSRDCLCVGTPDGAFRPPADALLEAIRRTSSRPGQGRVDVERVVRFFSGADLHLPIYWKPGEARANADGQRGACLFKRRSLTAAFGDWPIEHEGAVIEFSFALRCGENSASGVAADDSVPVAGQAPAPAPSRWAESERYCSTTESVPLPYGPVNRPQAKRNDAGKEAPMV